MTITAPSAYGVRSGVNTISGGSINVVATTTGYGIDSGSNTITGGKIHATTYGIYAGTTTLGSNDDTINISNPEIVGDAYALYQGTVNFYDGVLKGKDGDYTTDAIKAIPDGAIYHKEVIDEYHNCWLEQGENYLEVNGVEYNSMTKAYEAVTAEAGTITSSRP